jgi:hypothetical protein
MTELTDAPERQSRDPMDSHSDTRGVWPNLKRHWNRRWKRYLVALFALILAIFVTLMAIFLTRKHACYLGGFIPDGGAAVGVDLTKVLGQTVPDQVQIWACLDQRCVRYVALSGWTFVANDGEISDPEVDVRVVVRDHGRVIFDATRPVHLDEEQPNGPGCEPTFYKADVQATPEGDLIQQ